MLMRASDLPLDARGRVQADIVIVGAGAAGIVSAMELARGGRDVLVLEAGGPPPDDSRFEYFAGDNVGQAYDLVNTRYRGVGGATNLWAGWCRPLDQFEMEFHPWVGGLPWPLTRSDLMDHSRRAAQLLDLGAWEWNVAKVAREHERASLADVPGSEELLSSTLWRFAAQPLSFADRFADFIAGPESRIVVDAPVIRINARAGRARNLVISPASGQRIRVDFDSLILAAGGIENNRLLLEMQSRLRPRGQSVDESGWLGRGWQEHPHVPIGTAYLPRSVADGPLWMYTSRRILDGVPILAGLTFPTQTLRRQRMSAVSVTIDPQFGLNAPYAAGIGFAAEQVAGEGVLPHLLFARSESRTVRGSRVSLSPRTDALGRPQARLRWKIANGDFDDLGRAARMIAKAFARLNLGVVNVDAGRTTLAQRVWGGSHHIGGARMGENFRESVTDPFGAVHQIPNLYVTGSATFPSGGFSNPTLTIMALALRQADHILGRSGG